MKHLYHITALFIGLLALQACTPEQDELFDESASVRSTKEIARIKELLASVPNGWQVDYYGDLYYGGYNVLMSFKGDSVTVASEKLGPNHNAGFDAAGKCITATSHFKVEQSMGTVLSVDEYNDVFHYFSTPNNPDGYGTKDEGFLGDMEFRIITARNDSIIMRGKKHGDRIVMTPIPAETTWESLIQDAADTQAFIDSRNYTLEGEDFNSGVVGIKQYHTFQFQFRDSVGQLQTVSAPFISKKDGYHFYRPVNVNGVVMDGILKGDSRDKFLLANNHSLWLYPYLPTLVEHLTESYWFVSYSQLGAYAKTKWDSFKTKLLKSKKGNQDPEVVYAIFGKYNGNQCMFLRVDAIDIWQGFTFSKSEDETEITLKWASDKHNKDGDTYYKKYGFNDAIEPFYGKYGRTFKIETDNQRDPSYLRLTDKDEPTNVITLLATPVYYPFDN
jgi:hypothetical protein